MPDNPAPRWCRAPLIAVALALAAPLPVRAAGDATVEELLSLLQDKGVIQAAEYSRLVLRHQSDRAKAQPQRGSGGDDCMVCGLDWSGDLRIRHEAFWYEDGLGGTPAADDRYRMRYRFRLGFKKQVNDWLTVGMRIATSTGDHRSTNISFGDNENFGPGGLVLDRAWSEIKLPTPENLKAKLVLGKMSNPFTWKNGKDFMLWDGDINPEGVALVGEATLMEGTTLFGNLAYLIADESSGDSDAKLYAAQLGTSTRLSDSAELGLRASYYDWHGLSRSGLDADSFAAGNLACCAFDSGQASIGELAAYLALNPSPNWPLLFYGTIAQNFEADDSVLAGVSDEEDRAWGLGVEVGDKKKNVRLGFGYFEVEANAVVAQFSDSDLFDGVTNREGFMIYASRQVLDGLDFNVTFFSGEELEDDGGAAGPFSIPGEDDESDRQRLQTDLVFKF